MRGFPILAFTAMAACSVPGPDRKAAPVGEQNVRLGNEDYTALIGQGAPGIQLLAAGARPVHGQTIRIARTTRPLGMDEGRVAKNAARTACDAAGGRFQSAAIGHYQRQGSWIFPGGCS